MAKKTKIIIAVLAVVLIAGGAFYYFKMFKPKADAKKAAAQSAIKTAGTPE